jgi:DMSO/TMAO reductase YedYZ molybdopterin-dependent catalytic subunit
MRPPEKTRRTPFALGALGISLAIVSTVVAALAAAGCTSRPATGPGGSAPSAATTQSPVATSTSLGTVEVRDYQGKRLDAVADEPENSIKGPQHVDVASYRLGVTGAVASPLSLTYEQVTSMPAYEKVTTLNCVEGWQVTYLWQGVRLTDLFAKAGPDPSAKTVIFRSYDGYSTSLPLDYVVGRDILLAYKMNGVTMPAERGFPFQVVAEDRYGYKWAKWVTEIELSPDTNFRGYWETRGYDNGGALSGTP